MTLEEQKRIIRKLKDLGEQGAIHISKRVEEWAIAKFTKDGNEPELGSRGLCIQYRVAGMDEWIPLTWLSFTQFSWETQSDRRSRIQAIEGLFFFTNQQSSNQMGDVVAVRYMPYINVNNDYQLNEDEITLFECTDTGARRKWNHLEFKIYSEPSWGTRSYSLIRADIHKGKNICWFLPWHFSLADEAECPVAPIIVEKNTPYELVLRYRDQLYPLSMEVGKQHSVHLEEDVPVKPTHNWDSIWLCPPYTFTLVATLTWHEKLYGSSQRQLFSSKPHRVRTSDLPPGVRTREQIDHDAWEEAVRSGALNQRHWY